MARKLQRDLGHCGRARPPASRVAVVLGMVGSHKDRVRGVDEITVVTGREEEEESAGRRMEGLKMRFWTKKGDCQKPSAFETCRRGA